MSRRVIPEFASFTEMMERRVLDARDRNPTDARLDGQINTGNRDVYAKFWHVSRLWRVNSDTHYKPLLVAHEATISREFAEARTVRAGCDGGLLNDLDEVLPGHNLVVASILLD